MVAPARIDRSIQITPATLPLHIRLVNTPRPVGRFEMTPQALLEFRPISLHPPPYRRVVNFQTAFFEQLFDVAQGK
jgi:hypothetical protein